MIIINSVLEWLVLLIGLLIALSVLFPSKADKVGQTIAEKIPEPSAVNKYLTDKGIL